MSRIQIRIHSTWQKKLETHRLRVVCAGGLAIVWIGTEGGEDFDESPNDDRLDTLSLTNVAQMISFVFASAELSGVCSADGDQAAVHLWLARLCRQAGPEKKLRQIGDSKMDRKTVEKLERKLEDAIADVIMTMGPKKLPLLPSRHTMHMMAKAATAVYEAVAGDDGPDED